MRLRALLQFAVVGLLSPTLFACSTTATDATPTPSPVIERYACGWAKMNPGGLTSTGNEVGDVISNFGAMDQCDEEYKLWDGYGSYTIVFSMAFW